MVTPTKEQFLSFVKKVPKYIASPRFLLDNSTGMIYAISGRDWRGEWYPKFTREIDSSGEGLG